MSVSTYNQAVLLNDRYDGDINIIKEKLGVEAHQEAIDYFIDRAPEPLFILAPFLGLMREDIELENDFEQLCGILHEMDRAINFKNYIEVNYKVRADVKFDRRLINEYKRSWEDIQMKLRTDILPDEILAGLRTILVECTETIVASLEKQQAAPIVYPQYQPVYQTAITQEPVKGIEEVEQEEEEEEEIDFFAALNAALLEDKEKAGKPTAKVEAVEEKDLEEQNNEDTAPKLTQEELEIEHAIQALLG